MLGCVGVGKVRVAVVASLVGVVASLIGTTEADARRNKPRRAQAAKVAPYSPPYAAMIVDANTGRTMHAVNEDALRHPASVTKVMTLYLLFEQLQRGRLKLDSELKISRRAASMAPSKLGLPAGRTIAVEDAIKALITRSANDIACAIGENLAGTEEAFAGRMTRKARALGMKRTVFRNASGLPNPEQVTTARDLTILARAIQEKFPRYYKYFQTRVFEYAGQRIGNHNRLLGKVEGVDGIKTGFTNASGFNLMTSARQDGRHVVGVVLGGRSGASRDTIMAQLIRTNLARAAPSGRASVFANLQQDDDDDDAPVAVNARVASAEADDDVETTGSVSPAPTVAPVAVLPPTKPLQPGQKIEARLPFAPAVPAAEIVTARAQAPATPPVRMASLAPLPPERSAPAPRAPETVSRPIQVTPWVIQLAAEGDESKAKTVLDEAKAATGRTLARAAPFTEKINRGGTTLYRARFSGFVEADKAQEACRTLKSRGFACFATRS